MKLFAYWRKQFKALLLYGVVYKEGCSTTTNSTLFVLERAALSVCCEACIMYDSVLPREGQILGQWYASQWKNNLLWYEQMKTMNKKKLGNVDLWHASRSRNSSLLFSQINRVQETLTAYDMGTLTLFYSREWWGSWKCDSKLIKGLLKWGLFLWFSLRCMHSDLRWVCILNDTWYNSHRIFRQNEFTAENTNV